MSPVTAKYRKTKALASLRWFETQLRDLGYPVRKLPRTHNTYALGPLTVKGTQMSRISVAVQRTKEFFHPGPGKAFALITDAKRGQGEIEAQVVMDLESFTELVKWAVAGNPQEFLRAYKYGKDKDE